MSTKSKSSSSSKQKHRSSSDGKEKKSKKKEKKRVRTPSPEPEPENVYDDDFEDYDDDFEDDDEDVPSATAPKIEEKENAGDARKITNEKDEESIMLKRLSERQMTTNAIEPIRRQSTTTIVAPNMSLIDNKPIVLYNEEERKTAEQKANERMQKLRGLISIEISKSVVFTDMSSNIFEPFQALPSNLSHDFSQTGIDSKSEEAQTEKADSECRGTQFPHIESEMDNAKLPRESTAEDRARFKKFFFAATQVIREILASEEINNEEEEIDEKSTNQFSRGFNSFQLGAVAQRSKATCIEKGESDSVLIAFEIFESPAQDLMNKSLIVEYYVHKKKPPKRLFVVESIVVQMHLSIKGSTLYVCLKDGTLCAFDLSLSDSAFDDFLPWVDSESDIALRRPAFDSSFLATTISDASPLVGLNVSSTLSGEEIATIDASGTISYWLATRISKNELNIQLTAVIRPHPSLKRHSTTSAVTCFTTIHRPMRFFIGTDTGVLYSMQRSDTSQQMPKIYKTERDKYGEISAITSSRHDNSVILVGFSSGAIAIYRTNKTSPIAYLPKTQESTRVTHLQWSCSNSSAFYSTHTGHTVIYWDLSYGTSPRSIDKLDKKTTILSVTSWDNEHTKGVKGIAYMALALENGTGEVHILETPSRKGNDSLISILNKL
ncbi:unnamed protein product [Caenorhabditis bovis]|uniref:WD repeat-containing protein 60 n=1 Tax=Caenorhabditis bovis TaxID=2654633 RepID=A0A8S1ERX4_9PELO|nr:unnamed protein product [Caenorhabditis bovis]